METEREARDGAADREPRGSGDGRENRDGEREADPDAEREVERLRHENRRLEERLAAERRRRERLIDRYEALIPDGNEPERGRGDEIEIGDERGRDGVDRTGARGDRDRPAPSGVETGDGAFGGLRRLLVRDVRRAVTRLRRVASHLRRVVSRVRR